MDFKYSPTDWLNVNRWQKTFHKHGNHEKAGVAILIGHNIDFKRKIITKKKGIIL